MAWVTLLGGRCVLTCGMGDSVLGEGTCGMGDCAWEGCVDMWHLTSRDLPKTCNQATGSTADIT